MKALNKILPSVNRKNEDNDEIVYENIKKGNSKKQSKKLHIFSNLTTEKDTISPSLIREIDRKDQTIQGKPNDFYVEVGTTIGFARYFRSFFALLQPESTYYGMLNDLYKGDFGDADNDVAIHITTADETKTRFLLSRRIAGLESDLLNEKNSVKIKEIKDQLKELHAQEERLRKNLEKLYSASIQATVSSDSLDKLKKFTNSMVKRMSSNNVFFRSADAQQLPALMSMTPIEDTKTEFIHTYKNAETSNIADMFPFGFGTISHTNGVLLGEDINGKPVFYNDRHPMLQNYNSVTFGGSGAGKSLGRKILQGRKLPKKNYTSFIDFEHENKDWIIELGFPYIEFTPFNDEYTLNVFPVPRIVMTKKGETYADIDDAVTTVSAVVFKMINIIREKASLGGSKKILIKESILKCYSQKQITYNPNSIYEEGNEIAKGVYSSERKLKKPPQLFNLYEQMMGMDELKEEALIIKSFTKAGNIRSQSVFDNQSTVDFKNNLMVGMSVEGLDAVMRPLGLYVASSNSWGAYERMPKAITKDIVIDEAQNIMVEDEEALWLENRYRISRRRNVGMHAVTQGFEVFLRNQHGLGIMKNASTKFLFRQDAMDIDAVEGKFNLPDGARNRLLSFDKGECILIVANEMAVMKTKPMPYEYELFSTDPNEVSEEAI